MEFSDYLSVHKISKSRAARELKKSRSYISDIANKKIRPGRVLCEEIFRWSGGRVTFYDFYPELNPEIDSHYEKSPDKKLSNK